MSPDVPYESRYDAVADRVMAVVVAVLRVGARCRKRLAGAS